MNSYWFGAAVIREQVSSGIVGDVIERVFDGSAAALMLNLLKNEQLSKEEREELRLMIDASGNESEQLK